MWVDRSLLFLDYIYFQVILIQACQQSEDIPPLDSDDDMAMGCSPEDKTHIVLNRPHTALLMATMRDGFAKRGAYTEAIAEQLNQADGKSNLEDMHTSSISNSREVWR